MAAVRFPKIGSIIKLSDGTYYVGAIPGIGGPYNEDTIRQGTPPEYVDEIWESINEFPSRLANFAQHHSLRRGPFPIIHTDLYKSNILVDSEFCFQGVIDWENAIVAPWEMVEFIKDLSIVPPVMDGPLYHEEESDLEMLAERKRYIQAVQEVEEARQLDNKLSETLGDCRTQNLTHAIWLYLEGRIGFYSGICELFQ